MKTNVILSKIWLGKHNIYIFWVQSRYSVQGQTMKVSKWTQITHYSFFDLANFFCEILTAAFLFVFFVIIWWIQTLYLVFSLKISIRHRKKNYNYFFLAFLLRGLYFEFLCHFRWLCSNICKNGLIGSHCVFLKLFYATTYMHEFM